VTDGPVKQLNDLEHGHIGRRPGKAVSAADSALRAQDSGAAQVRKQLLQELDRDLTSPRKLGDRHGRRTSVEM
jgi:hypothetical protein